MGLLKIWARVRLPAMTFTSLPTHYLINANGGTEATPYHVSDAAQGRLAQLLWLNTRYVVPSRRSHGRQRSPTHAKMQRVKNVQYEDDDVYDEDEDYAEEEAEAGESYSAEDRENFATLTPVVRAELEEAGVQASDREIEEALWHYYWDVGKTVTYLKNNKTPKARHAKKEEAKPKSKFDQAAEKSAKEAGESISLSSFSLGHMTLDHRTMYGFGRRGGRPLHHGCSPRLIRVSQSRLSYHSWTRRLGSVTCLGPRSPLRYGAISLLPTRPLSSCSAAPRSSQSWQKSEERKPP